MGTGRGAKTCSSGLFSVQRLAEEQSGLGTGLSPSTAPLRFLAGPWPGEVTAIDQGLWSCPWSCLFPSRGHYIVAKSAGFLNREVEGRGVPVLPFFLFSWDLGIVLPKVHKLRFSDD